MRLRGDVRARLDQFQLNTGEFDLKLQGVTAVFGRSGAGKSSFLQVLAGHLRQAQGWLQFGEQPVWTLPKQAPPAHQRQVVMVFQQAGLFPHLDVRGNLLFAAKRSGADAAELLNAAADCGIENLLGRKVQDLSGGETQRVALARALLAKPRLFCLDEPVSALDWSARAQLLDLIAQLAEKQAVPVLYVSHEAAEVERIAAQLIHFESGRISTVESLQASLQRLDSPLFADHQAASVLFGQVSAPDQWGLSVFESRQGACFRLLLNASATGVQRRLRVQARDVSLAREPVDGISMLNQLPVRVQELAEPQDGRVLVRLSLNENEALLSEITAWSAQQLGLCVGDHVFALIKSVALLD